jgi:hypothetical protein
LAWGISDYRARQFREQWLRTGHHNSPQPRNYSNNADPEYRYYYDEVMGLPEGTWPARFKAQQKLDFAIPTDMFRPAHLIKVVSIDDPHELNPVYTHPIDS